MLSGKVYAFGGWNGAVETDSIEIHDAKSGVWNMAPFRMFRADSGFASVVIP